MARRKRNTTGIPDYEINALARAILPAIQALFETEDGQREFEEWKEQKRQLNMKQIEVKGDNKIDDTVVQAKAAAALEMASASKMGCLMLESTRIMKKKFYNFVVHTKILLHAEEKRAFDLKIKNAFFRPKMRCAVTISS